MAGHEYPSHDRSSAAIPSEDCPLDAHLALPRQDHVPLKEGDGNDRPALQLEEAPLHDCPADGFPRVVRVVGRPIHLRSNSERIDLCQEAKLDWQFLQRCDLQEM